MKKISIGHCTLYHGDSLNIMPTLQPVDCVVTDPPYRLTSGGNSRLGQWQVAKEYNNDGGIVPCEIDWLDFMPLIFKALKDPAHAYIMANNRHVQNMLNAAQQARFGFHNLLVWDKITATPNRWYMKNLEYIGFFYKGNAFHINDCSAKQLIKCPQVDQSAHPTEKPVALMQTYIENSTRRHQKVLDPFMGSGSTGVAAINSGRKFIGIEKDERYFDMAVKRIMEAVEKRQNNLFGAE